MAPRSRKAQREAPQGGLIADRPHAATDASPSPAGAGQGRVAYPILAGRDWLRPAGAPPGAKLVEGVWLPAAEVHFEKMLRHVTEGGKSKVVTRHKGRSLYQGHKLFKVMELMAAAGAPLRTALDVGAHVGLWAMTLVERFGHVVAIEPLPEHAALFPWNCRTPNWTLHQAAAGNRPGTAVVQRDPPTSGAAHVVDPAPGVPAGDDLGPLYCAAPMIALDDLALDAVDLVKVDVEGFELQVLQGLEQTLRRCKPWLVIEQKGNDVKHGLGPAHGALAFAKSLGAQERGVLSGDFILSW